MNWVKTSIAAACVGLALAPAAAAQSMPDGWRFVLQADGGVMPCAVVREGPVRFDPTAVNARLMRNRGNKIVLAAARFDWELDPNRGPTTITLVIDNAAPIELQGHPLGPLFMTLVEGPELTQKLRAAEAIKWITPWGQFHAKVTGLGAAFDLTTLCPE